MAPEKVSLGINNICNLRCIHCDVGQRNTTTTFYDRLLGRNESYVPIDKLRKRIDQIALFKPSPYISILYTEPLLYPDIIELCEYLAYKKLKFSITTNGYLLEKYASGLVRSGTDLLRLPLDGPKEVHNKIRGVEDAYERLRRGINRIKEERSALRSSKPRIELRCAMFDANYRYIYKTYEAMNEISPDIIGFMHYTFLDKAVAIEHNRSYGDSCYATDYSSSMTDPRQVDIKILSQQLKQIRETALKDGIKKLYIWPDIVEENELENYYHNFNKPVKDYNKCTVPWSVMVVFSDGDIAPAARCFKNWTIGNIDIISLKSAWNNKRMRHIRSLLLKHKSFPACLRCCGIFNKSW